MDALDRAIAAARAVQEEVDADPIRAIRWMVPQLAYLKLQAHGRRWAYRAGNQALGKSTVGLASVLMHCRGRHPYREVKPPPVKWVVCSLNQTQSLAIQEKFHDLAGVEDIDPSTPWNPKTGYGANKPLTLFRNGSSIRWVTDDQGPRAVAGSTLDGVLIDEPCSPEMYRELGKRLLKRRGVMLLTFTPINGPTAHLREAIEEGQVAEVHAPLTTDNLRWADDLSTVTLEDGTPCDQKWIDEIWAETSQMEADIVNNGGWERTVEGVFFNCFDVKVHSKRAILPSVHGGRKGVLRWYLGIDYAAADREFGQCAVLVQVLEMRSASGAPDYWINVADERVATGTVDTEDFAVMVVAMLREAGLTWAQVEAIHGDNPVASRFEKRSNDIMMNAVARELRIAQKALKPRIMNAKEGVRADTQLTEGVRALFKMIAHHRVNVSPKCAHLINGLQTWDLSSNHPRKDVIDALRYALKPVFFPRGVKSGAVTVRFAA